MTYHQPACPCEICRITRGIVEILPDVVNSAMLINIITRILYAYNISVEEFEEVLPDILTTLQKNLEHADASAPPLN